MSSSPSDTYKPHPGAQEAFHRSNAFEIGYGGAAGGGKTESILRESLRQVDKPSYTAALFRRTYPELELSLINKAREVFPNHGGKPKDGGKIWYFPTKEKTRPARIIFAHLEHDHDVHKYQSAEFDVLGFDEATSFSDYQYSYMRSRVRGKDQSIRRYVMAATNPGNIGHTWFKKRFVDNRVPYQKYWFKLVNQEEVECDKSDPDALSRVFIPARVYDNPTLLGADPKYLARLRSLPDKERRMLLDGSWDVFEGQYFSDWNIARHVIEPFTIPGHWKRVSATDYGATKPFCTLWGAQDPDKGDLYIYREYYVAGKEADEHGRQIYLLGKDEEVQWNAADPSIFPSKSDRGQSILAQLVKGGYKKFIPANNARLAGWNAVKQLMRPKNMEDPEDAKQPNIYVFKNCTNLIRTIPEMIHDQYNPEDLNTDLEDHAPDTLRYMIQTLYRIAYRPKKVIEDKDLQSAHTEDELMKKFKLKQKAKRQFNVNSFYQS